MKHDAARLVGLYRRRGLAWEEARRAAFIERTWLDRFLALLPHGSSGARVLDLGCGGGQPIARYLADAGCRVTGIDTAPALLALCRTRLPGHAWRRGDMRRVAIRQRFDGILAWDSFFHLCRAEQRAMFPRFRRHAAPGAALMFTSGPRDGEAIGMLGGERLHHASLAPAAYRRLLGANGFRIAAHVAEDAACGGHTVWLAYRGRHSPFSRSLPISR